MMYRKLTAVLLVMLLVAGVLPVTAQEDTYTLFLTDDESFGFVYPADWEYSIDADVGSVNLVFDAGILFVYAPQTVAALAGSITDPVKLLASLAGELGATADDITDLDPGAALMTLEEEDGVTYIRQLVAMPLSDGSLGLIQLYVEIDRFEDFVNAFLVIALTMDVYAPGTAPGPADVEAMLMALGIEGSGGGGGGGDVVLYSFGGDYQRTIAALRSLNLIPTGGSLLFTEDYAYFTGQGSFYTPLARNSARTNFVMSAELSYEPSATTELETCTLGMRVTWSGNSATAYMDVGYTSAGTVYYLDLPTNRDNLAVEEIDPGVSVLVPHTFTIIVLDDMITVFMDDTLIFQDMPVEARSGTWGVGLEGKGTGALCEARDIWVFQLDS